MVIVFNGQREREYVYHFLSDNWVLCIHAKGARRQISCSNSLVSLALFSSLACALLQLKRLLSCLCVCVWVSTTNTLMSSLSFDWSDNFLHTHTHSRYKGWICECKVTTSFTTRASLLSSCVTHATLLASEHFSSSCCCWPLDEGFASPATFCSVCADDKLLSLFLE